VLKGRLGLERARVPYKDRHGLMWLARGNLAVQDGTLHFTTAGGDRLEPGDYDIPFQMLTAIVLEPGTTVSHDALRLLARHGTGLIVSGTDGVRLYASMPFGPDRSRLARNQVTLWADPTARIDVARKMYAVRMGELLPHTDLDTLRGMEGARVRRTYKLIAQRFGIEWTGRNYDRQAPDASDDVNQALNHASTAVVAAAQVAVAAAGAIPQLGFIHEDSGIALCLDVADLYRETITLPAAFHAVKQHRAKPDLDMERLARQRAGYLLRHERVVSGMITRLKEMFNADDGGGDP
jgi:CRISPR-associated protein Cas1